jgi:hypothetical protein
MNSKGEAAATQKEKTPSEGTSPQLADGPSLEEIRQRAYEIHVERGGAYGQDLEDWLQAEVELKAKYRIG